MSVIFQNLAQMQNRYPLNQWQEIIGNCDVQLFLGCTDEITAKFISDRTGEVTIGVSSESKELSTWRVSDYTPGYRQTSSIGKRKLMTMDEVLRLPVEKALVILRGQKVLKVDKYDFSQHPESKKMMPSKASSYVPNWRSKLEEKEPEVLNLAASTKASADNPGRESAKPAAKQSRKRKTPVVPKEELMTKPEVPSAAEEATESDTPDVTLKVECGQPVNHVDDKPPDKEVCSFIEIDKDSIMS